RRRVAPRCCAARFGRSSPEPPRGISRAWKIPRRSTPSRPRSRLCARLPQGSGRDRAVGFARDAASVAPGRLGRVARGSPSLPRNASSRRVAEKLGLRDEGTAVRFLQIQSVYEDHIRYAISVEEWRERGHELLAKFVNR